VKSAGKMICAATEQSFGRGAGADCAVKPGSATCNSE